ncbi:MAG: DUF4392 domain-containing protein [Alphaproteobacteria bacterium]
MAKTHPLFDLIDRLVCLDIGGRGMAGLFEPARARHDEPVCLAAARPFAALQRGDVAFILTGSLSRASVTTRIAENDGPMGAAVLARAVSYGFNAIPVVLCDASTVDKVAAMVQLAGCNVMTMEEARRGTSLPRFTAVAVMATGAIDDAEAQTLSKRQMDAYAPKVVLSVERAGLTADGTYRNALGQDYSEGRERLDHLVFEAQRRGIPTIGIGDGGNEIGMGAVKQAVFEHVPYGPQLCAESSTDVLIPAGVSNWGCYALAAVLAILTGNPTLAHTPELERRMIEAAAQIGLIDGMAGRLDPTVDGMPIAVHCGLVSMLANIVERAVRQGVKA